MNYRRDLIVSIVFFNRAANGVGSTSIEDGEKNSLGSRIAVLKTISVGVSPQSSLTIAFSPNKTDGKISVQRSELS